MKIKHKVIKEFQYLSPDKKIFILKLGTILEDYIYKVKTELIPIDKDIIDNNPDFFIVIDWKAELLTYLKTNKIPQPAVLGKKLLYISFALHSRVDFKFRLRLIFINNGFQLLCFKEHSLLKY